MALEIKHIIGSISAAVTAHKDQSDRHIQSLLEEFRKGNLTSDALGFQLRGFEKTRLAEEFFQDVDKYVQQRATELGLDDTSLADLGVSFDQQEFPKKTKGLQGGEISLNLATRRLAVGEGEIDILPQEAKYVRRLVEAGGGRVKTDELAKAVYGRAGRREITNMMNSISRVRKALGVQIGERSAARLLQAARGEGYRLGDPDSYSYQIIGDDEASQKLPNRRKEQKPKHMSPTDFGTVRSEETYLLAQWLTKLSTSSKGLEMIHKCFGHKWLSEDDLDRLERYLRDTKCQIPDSDAQCVFRAKTLALSIAERPSEYDMYRPAFDNQQDVIEVLHRQLTKTNDRKRRNKFALEMDSF